MQTQKGDFLLCERKYRPELESLYRAIHLVGCTLTRGELVRMASEMSSKGYKVKSVPDAIRRVEESGWVVLRFES